MVQRGMQKLGTICFFKDVPVTRMRRGRFKWAKRNGIFGTNWLPVSGQHLNEKAIEYKFEKEISNYKTTDYTLFGVFVKL